MLRMLVILVGLVSLAVATGQAEQAVADPPKLPSHLAPKPANNPAVPDRGAGGD
jgi:hypothetical protein